MNISAVVPIRAASSSGDAKVNSSPNSSPYPKKLFSKLRAQDRVSPKLKVESSQLAVIPTGSLEEKLCYEFKCKAQNGRNVLVYLNAETGEEEQILLLVETPTGTLTV